MPVLLPGGNIAASTRKEPMSEAAESLVLYSRDSENSENKTPGFWRHFIIFYLKQLISRCCNFHVSVFSFWLRCKPRPDLLIGNKTLFFRVSRLVLFYGVYGRGFDRDLVKNISSCRATLSSSGKWLHREYARQPSWHCFLKWSTLQSTSLLISDKSDKSGHHLMQFDGSRWTLTWVVPWKWWNHVGRSPRSLWSHGWLCIQVKITGLSWPLRWNGTVMTGEEMRLILQSLGISVAWSQILVTSGTKRRNKQGPEGRNSGERRVQRPRWLSAPWNCI